MYVTFANSHASRFASSRRRARHPPDRSIGRDEKAAKTEERSNGGLNDVESSTRSSKKSVARSSSSSRRVFHAMPAPWIEHGILSLRRRAPVETGARTVQRVALFHECAGVGTRLTRYHCAIQASARTRPSPSACIVDDRRVSTPSRGGLTGRIASFHGSPRVLWGSMEGLGRVWVGFG